MQLTPNTELQNGKYRIIRVLGQGGFGITYLALHTMLDKQVAIKEFFPKEFCTRNDSHNNIIITGNNTELIDHLRKRFLKEAKNIAKLDHPGIVKIHDVFQENGSAYYVMDYIEGENLSQIIKNRGALFEDNAIEYIIKIGEALEYMHSKDMTHFDVKPANIIIRKKDSQPILIDFGLSKQYHTSSDETSTLLQAISNGYSPIELYDTSVIKEFSPQTDIYSLGATLFYMLTNQVPAPAVSLVSQGLSKPTEIATPIFNTILTAMASDSSHRYQTISNFTDALKRIYLKKNNACIPFAYSKDGIPSIKLLNKNFDIKIRVGSLLEVGSSVGILCFYFICIIILGAGYCIDYSADIRYSLQTSIPLLIKDPIREFIWTITLVIGMVTSLIGVWGIYFLSILKRKGLILLSIGIIGFLLFFISTIFTHLSDIFVYLLGQWTIIHIFPLIFMVSLIIFILAIPIYVLIHIIQRWSLMKSFLINPNKDSDFFWVSLTIIPPLFFDIIRNIWYTYHQ